MIYQIMNRMDARQATYVKESIPTAIISITDTGDKKNSFYPQTWIIGILELQFLDYEAPNRNCITKQQAKEIAQFAKSYYSRVERFIVHCEFGQSRSAGVAAALSKHFDGHDSGIFKSPAYFPNKTCYRYVYQALEAIK